jgi:hypothetical protein
MELDPFMANAYVRDPEGNLVELQSWSSSETRPQNFEERDLATPFPLQPGCIPFLPVGREKLGFLVST